MSTIAILHGRSRGTRAVMVVGLAALGLVAGFGLAHLGATVAPTTAGAITPQISADESYRLQVASERALVTPQISADESYRLHWASERGLTAP